MTPWQKQIITGTILGGSSLIKPKKGVNYYLCMAGNDECWQKYKMEELADFFPNTKITVDGSTYRCASQCQKEFSVLYNKIYKDGKRHITNEVLDPLRDIALAIWFIDGGGKTGRGNKNAYLNLTKMKQSTTIIKNYFCDLDIDCELNMSSNRTRLVFSVDGTECLLKIIASKLPSFMYYRL